MTRVIFVAPDGESRSVEVLAGLNIMEAAVHNDIEGIIGECGGSCICGTCHVRVDEAWYPGIAAMESNEAAMLSGMENTCPTSRLACQIKLRPDDDGLILHTLLPQT